MKKVFELKNVGYIVCDTDYFVLSPEKLYEMRKNGLFGYKPFSWKFRNNGVEEEYTINYFSDDNRELGRINISEEEKILSSIPNVLDFIRNVADDGTYSYKLCFTDNGLPYLIVTKI